MPRKHANIFLIGPRGSGKSTLGRLLAERLDRAFVDTDELLLDRLGLNVRSYVGQHGWEAFRTEETAVLQEICAGQGQVVATGGGVVLAPVNRDCLARSGLVVYLKTTPEILLERLAVNPRPELRPALTGLDPAREMAQICQERDSLYRACAHVVLDASGPPERLLADLCDTNKLGAVDDERQ